MFNMFRGKDYLANYDYSKVAWSEGKGWWLGGVDDSLYNDVTINFEATDATVKLVIKYVMKMQNTLVRKNNIYMNLILLIYNQLGNEAIFEYGTAPGKSSRSVAKAI